MTRLFSTTPIFAYFVLWLTGCAAPLTVAVPKAPVPASPFNTTTAGTTTVVAVSPPSQACCPHQTLPELLGITQCVGATQTRCARGLACLGFLFPGLGAALEPTPPLLPITDPANLNSPDPAIKAAAEIKSNEDAAPQKIAALRYLATIGCDGCNKGVEEAFLHSMDEKECTEEVRYEAVLAVRATACSCTHCDNGSCSSGSCGGCANGSCCSAKIQKKLRELAYETDDNGCPKERSERVRRQARLALEQCGPAVEEPAPAEKPKDEAPLKEGRSEEPSASKDNKEESSEEKLPSKEDAPGDKADEGDGEQNKPADGLQALNPSGGNGLIIGPAGGEATTKSLDAKGNDIKQGIRRTAYAFKRTTSSTTIPNSGTVRLPVTRDDVAQSTP